MTFRHLPDLALRGNGGSVIAANDEAFAERQALILPHAAQFHTHDFGAKGQIYDGWETRRRRTTGHDWAIVRLGLPGVVHGLVIDTAWFKGNYPPYASVDACAVDEPLAHHELTGWTEILPKSPLGGDREHEFAVGDPNRYTHVRLNIYPDGGVARFRVHGEVVPDPRFLHGLTVDLAALSNGARVIDCSNQFYSSPNNVIAPGLARHQAEGWETARRRDDGNDWLVVRLAGRGTVTVAEIDTTHLVFNAPGWVSLSGRDGDGDWFSLLGKTRLQPDAQHRFRLDSDRPVTHVKCDIYPDGGLARLRLPGRLVF
ncbi:allantoicase [Herbidospora yilanensis]|uniref:allantoicase n=1 Tax=Herbidospora yilanensis TaxID=354426 RepID=UPI0007830F46|nr:allantoicase [Herbidospora yilanensis]